MSATSSAENIGKCLTAHYSDMEKIRTGIYGGSFNPIHNGHIAIARAMTEKAGLDEVWLVVSPQNPLKATSSLLADDKRLLMARTALQGVPHMVASDYEFHLPRPSYMWNTLQSLSHDFPNRDFTLLIGADNWAVFHRWYRATDIIAHYPILIYPRTGWSINPATLPPTVHLIDTGLYDVSSTQVRQLIAQGADISHLVPESVIPMAQQFYTER